MYLYVSMANMTNLTDRQIEVLKMRGRGMTQAKIAHELGTTKPNISIIESQAKANIIKARNTLEFARLISAPIWINVDPETDVYAIPGMIFREADKHNIWIPKGGPSLLSFIEEKAQDKLRNRRILEKIDIGITTNGDVLIQ